MSEYFRKYIKKEHYPVHPSTIRFKTNFKNCVLDGLRKRQWKEVEQEDWDFIWAEKEQIQNVLDHVHLNPNMKLNHFRNYFEMCRKDLLIKNLKKHKKYLKEKENKPEEAASYDYFPLSYNLPSEYSIFYEEFKKHSSDKQLWIMKPIAQSQGKGIFIFRNINEIKNWRNQYKYNPDNPQADPYVVQKYINNPLLLGGKKFDLRIYALCVSYQPLTVYLYRTGFARFTHYRYDAEDVTNIFAHLTNVAIQKTSENYDEKLGGKWMLQTLKLFMISKFGQEQVSETFYQIQQIIIKTLLSVQKQIMNDKRCFELYGFDILIDDDLKPWLLEVNGSPSMTANTQVDYDLKCGVLDDVLTIVDMEKILSGQEEQIGGFDLIYKNAPVRLPPNSTYSTLLGCYNNRNQQLKKLAKSTAIRLSQQFQEQQQRQSGDQKQRSNSKGPVNPQQNNKTSTMQRAAYGYGLKNNYQNGGVGQNGNGAPQGNANNLNNNKFGNGSNNAGIPTGSAQQPQNKVNRKPPLINNVNTTNGSQAGSVNGEKLPAVGVANGSIKKSDSGQKPPSPMKQTNQPNNGNLTTNQKVQLINQEKKFEPYKREEQQYQQFIGGRQNQHNQDEDEEEEEEEEE